MWTLDNALPLIRRISPTARRHGFALALYGSVLDKGESEKDLDLFFIRRELDSCDVQGCMDEIAKLPEIEHIGTPVEGTREPVYVIWFSDPKRTIDAQFRLL